MYLGATIRIGAKRCRKNSNSKTPEEVINRLDTISTPTEPSGARRLAISGRGMDLLFGKSQSKN